MSAGEPGAGESRQPTEEELRAAYEAELKRITVADVVLQTVVSLVNLAGRRLGLAQGSEDERDVGQARDAIDAVRGLMPVLERQSGAQVGPIRDALAQLQMEYARAGSAGGGDAEPGGGGDAEPGGAGGEPGGGGGGGEGGGGEGPGPAQSSGRLWVPGQ